MRFNKLSVRVFFALLLSVINSIIISGQMNPPDTSSYLPSIYPNALNYNLIIAASKGYDTEIERLVFKGADIEAEFNEGVTPLIMSVVSNRLSTVRTLLDLGADPDRITARGETPLLIAMRTYKSEYFNNIVFSKSRPNQQLIDIAEALIRAGADINYRDHSGVTVLNYCSVYGLNVFADLLIYYGADVNLKSNDGTTPLMAAAWSGFPDIAALLIKNGANIEARDNSGFTPFLIAAQNGDTLIMNLLIKNGIDLYEKNSYGWNAINLAVKSDQKPAVEFLLKKGDKWMDSSKNAYTPYDVAVKYGRKDLVDYLSGQNLKNGSSFRVDQLALSAGTKFTLHDFYSGFDIGFIEPLRGYSFHAGIDTKLWYTKVIVKENENFYYQYKDKSSIVYAGISKDFRLTRHIFRGNESIYTSLNLGYFFSEKFKGTDKMPEEKFKLIPSAGLKWTKDNLSLFAGLEFTGSDFTRIGPLWGRAGCSYSFNFDRLMAPGKKIKWY